MAGLNFAFTADNKNFMKALSEIQKGVEDTSRRIESEGVNIEKFFNRIRDLSAISFAGVGLSGFINKIKDTRAYFQDIESSMRVFLGDAEKANEFTAKLQDYAYYNMFDFADLAAASKQLIAYGNNVENVIPTIHKLSEVAIATNVPLEEMVHLYNRAKSTGVVGSQDIASWAAKGLILKDVMKEMGTYVEGQTISFKQLNEVLDHVTAEGGLFHGIQDAQMENISANIGQLEDSLSLMFNEIGTYLQKPIYEVLQFGNDVIEHWQEIGFAIASLASAAGIQKGVELATTTIDRTATQAIYSAEIAQLKELLPEKEAEEKTSLQQAVASGHLTEEKAKEIEKLREEAEAYREVLAEKVKNAEADLVSATNDVNDLTDWKDELDEKISKTQDWMDSIAENAESLEDLADCEEYLTAMDELSSLETERNSVVTEINSAEKRKNAAATTLASASYQQSSFANELDTAAKTKNNFVTRLCIAAETAYMKVKTKVNALVAANPWAVAIAGVAALAYGIHKLVTYETDLEKSQRKVNEAVEETQSQANREIDTLDRLATKLSTTKKGSDEWKATKDAIVKQFGQYLPQLDQEIMAVGNLSTAYNDLTDAIKKTQAAKGLKNFLDKNDNYEDRESKFREGLEDLDKSNKLSDRGKELLTPILREFSLNADSGDDIYTFVEQKLKEKYGNEYGQKTYDFYKDDLKKSDLRNFLKANKMSRLNEQELQQYAKDLGIDNKTLDSVRYNIDTSTEYEDARTERQVLKQQIDADKKAWEELDKSTEEGKKKAAELEKNIKANQADFNKRFGNYDKDHKQSSQTSAQLLSKTAAEEQQVTDLLKKQAEERLRQQQAYEYELWQNRIDLMDDGEAKVIAQMRLDNAKEITALKERQEQEIQAEIANQKALFDAREDVNASKDKKYAKKVFNPERDIDTSSIDAINERYTQLYADLAAKQAKAEQDRLDAAKESMNAYLQEFGNYQQKRLAIQEEYETKIAEAQDEGQRMMLFAQRDKALSDLDYSEWIDSGDIALAFGDISKLSDSTIEQLIADMERYREKVVATFDPDKIREYEEALKGLRDAQSEISFGVFADVIPDYFKQRKSVADSRMSAGANLNALRSQRDALLVKKSGLEGAKAMGGNVDKELAEVNAQLNDNENATRKAQNAFKQLQEQWDKMNSPEDKFYGICAAVNQAADLVGGLANQAASMADALGADGLGEAMGYLGDAMNSVINIASGFANGGIIGGIAAVAGEAMNWVGKIFAAGDNKKQKNIERLQEQIDALNKSYEKLNSKIDDAFSTDASNLIDQQNTLLQQQKVLIRQQIAEEEAKKKTDDDKIKEYKERLEEIDETLADNKKKAKEAIIGEDIKSAIKEFSDAYASAFENGTDAASKSVSAVKNLINSALTEWLNKKLQPTTQRFYDKLAEYMKDGKLEEWELQSLDAIKAEMDRIAAEEEAKFKTIQDRYKDLDELKEELTDISFDSVRDDFKSQLLDMEADATDFTNSFTDMLRNALVEGLMNNKYDAMLKEWYDEFAEAMNDQALSDEERDSLRQQYQAIIDQGIADRNAINEIVGSGAYSQEASTGGWESMGQDQADELNGRFTALTELQVINNDLQQTQNVLALQILATLQSMNAISGISNGSDPTLLAIKDMMFLSTGYLEDIAKYTKILNTVDERLATLNTTIERRL